MEEVVLRKEKKYPKNCKNPSYPCHSDRPKTRDLRESVVSKTNGGIN